MLQHCCKGNTQKQIKMSEGYPAESSDFSFCRHHIQHSKVHEELGHLTPPKIKGKEKSSPLAEPEISDPECVEHAVHVPKQLITMGFQ